MLLRRLALRSVRSVRTLDDSELSLQMLHDNPDSDGSRARAFLNVCPGGAAAATQTISPLSLPFMIMLAKQRFLDVPAFASLILLWRHTFLLVTADSILSACSSILNDEFALQLPLDGHCGGLSLHVKGSSHWCNLKPTHQFVLLYVQSSSLLVSRTEFCSGLTLTVPAGVHKLSIVLHDELPSNLDSCEGCSCLPPVHFVADPLLNGPDVFSQLLSPTGLPIIHRLLTQMQKFGYQGVDLVLGLHAGVEDSRLLLFLKSLRASCLDCFIVLFCREISSSALLILSRTNAWCIPYDFWRANSTFGPAGDHRFVMYSHFLALAGSCVRNVFLSDVRDVAFQGSPFDSLNLAPLDVVFFLEDRRRLIQVNL
jgi:hypothetical protein